MKRLWVYLRPYRAQCVLGPIFKLLEAILELLLPTVMALVINNGVERRDSRYVLWMGGLMAAMALVGFGCSCVCQYSAAKASQGFGTRLRDDVFRRVLGFSYQELDRFGPATLTNRLTSDINQLQLAVAMFIRLVIRAPFICIGAIAMAMILDLKLAQILLAAVPLFVLVLYLIVRASSPLYARYQRQLDRLAALVRENLSGVRVIRAFARRDHEEARFAGANGELNRTANRVGRISALLSPVTAAIMNGVILLVLWTGGRRIQLGSFTQGETIAFINYVTQILLALVVVSNLVVIFTRAFASAGRINELLAVIPAIDGPGAQPDPAAAAVEFQDVSFAYSATGDLALEHISFAAGRGERVGIIGPTGSGKSTLVQLIGRHYDATGGSVRVMGADVRQYALRQLRGLVAIAPQRGALFAGTVADNLRLGRPEATEAELEQAARTAQALEFIQALPQGFAAPVARGGQNFSGGQRQRLSIARALAARPQILILDDSASALDFATEAALRRALARDAGETTVFIVTQRAGSIRDCDRILVLDDGQLVGMGAHRELLHNCPAYREICLSQMSAEEAEA